VVVRIATYRNILIWLSGKVIRMRKIPGKRLITWMWMQRNFWSNIMWRMQMWRKIRDLDRKWQDRKKLNAQEKEWCEGAEKRKFFICFIWIILFRYLSGIFCFVHISRRSYHWVTGPREGGSVRGSPLAAVMIYVWTQQVHVTNQWECWYAKHLPAKM